MATTVVISSQFILMKKSREIYALILEDLIILDYENPANPTIKRLFYQIYQLGKRQNLIDESNDFFR